MCPARFDYEAGYYANLCGVIEMNYRCCQGAVSARAGSDQYLGRSAYSVGLGHCCCRQDASLALAGLDRNRGRSAHFVS